MRRNPPDSAACRHALRRADRARVGAVASALLVSLAALTACQSTTETSVGITTDSAPLVSTREARPNDPLPPLGNVEVITGDTLRLTSGKRLRLYGLRAPQPGEPYYLTSKRWLRSLIGHQIVRLSYKAGTKYTDPVWYVNVMVPNRDQSRGGALSANVEMLAHGLAREDGLNSLEFARVVQGGKLEPFSDDENRAVREHFRRHALEARKESRNIFSGVREP